MSMRLSGIRALVIEDHEDTRDLFCAILSYAGATAECYTSRDAAIDAATSVRPDVIIAELQLDTGDASVISMIRKRLGRFVPAVCVTSRASATDRDRALRAGFQEYIVKPVYPDALVETIERVLRDPVAGPARFATH